MTLVDRELLESLKEQCEEDAERNEREGDLRIRSAKEKPDRYYAASMYALAAARFATLGDAKAEDAARCAAKAKSALEGFGAGR